MSLLASDTHFHDLPCVAYCKSRRCPAKSGGFEKGDHHWPNVLSSLRQWFNVAWFERAWTVQEMVLAHSATLLLGTETLPWATVSKAWANLSRHMQTCCTECIYGLPEEEVEDLYRISERIRDLANAKQKLEIGQHLIILLLHFRWKKSSDPRDKLHGLLGLQSGRLVTPVVPDYTASLQDMFTRFAADTVISLGWLAPLCLDLTQSMPDMPSWVPYWTMPSEVPAGYAIARFMWSATY